MVQNFEIMLNQEIFLKRSTILDLNVKFMSTIRNFELNEINKQLVYSFLIYADIKENYDIGKCHDYE